MNLIWHIAKKDLRRMALPVALWCVPVVGRVVLPWLALGSTVTDAAGYRIWEGMLALLMGMDVIVAAILVAALVQEDVPTGTNAWWPTRPIAGGRLLLAKFMGGVVLFVAAPLIPLSVAWVAAGMSATEWLAATVWFAITHTVIAIIALGLAATAENLAQFLFGAIGVIWSFVLLAAYIDFDRYIGLTRASGVVRHSGQEWMMSVALVGMVALFLNQYLTRRRDRTFMILSAGIVLLVGIRLAWRGTSQPLSQLIGDVDAPIRDEAEDRAVKISESAATAGGGTISLRFTIAGVPKGALALPTGTRGKVDGDATEIMFGRNDPVASGVRPAVFAVAGLAGETENTSWNAHADLPATAGGSAPTSLSGQVAMRWMHGRPLGELSLQPGAELIAGSSVTRMLDIRQEDDRFVVTLFERDPLPPRKYWPDMNGMLGRIEVVDYYVLINRTTGLVQLLDRGDAQGLNAGTMLTSQRRLSVPLSAAVPGWDQGAVLLKVRFELDHFFIRPFTAERIGSGS